MEEIFTTRRSLKRWDSHIMGLGEDNWQLAVGKGQLAKEIRRRDLETKRLRDKEAVKLSENSVRG
jgi:hypothetical protein